MCAGRVTGILDVRAEMHEQGNALSVSHEDSEEDSGEMRLRQQLKEKLGALMTGFVEEGGANE